MADSTTLKVRVQYAVGGDYQTLPLAVDYGNGRDLVSAVPTNSANRHVSVSTSGTTVYLSGSFTTVSALYILNEDTTNYVTATWTSNGAANSQKISAGAPFLVPQADVVNLLLTANTAACVCTVIVFGT